MIKHTRFCEVRRGSDGQEYLAEVFIHSNPHTYGYFVELIHLQESGAYSLAVYTPGNKPDITYYDGGEYYRLIKTIIYTILPSWLGIADNREDCTVAEYEQ